MAFFSGLPQDLITEILLWLPVRSLGRFRSVCKSWNSLIPTSTFIQVHLERSAGRRQILLLSSYVTEYGPTPHDGLVFSLLWDDDSPSHVYNNDQDKFMDHPLELYNFVHVVDSCRGLVCLHAPDGLLTIWNPCIRKHVILPKLSTYGGHSTVREYGFGYDSTTNDYKVVRVEGRYKSYNGDYGDASEWSAWCAVWSLKKPYWNILSADVFPVTAGSWLFRSSVLFRGVVHWVLKDKNNRYSILSFDISDEQFGAITIPELGLSIYSHGDVSLSRYRKSLALLCGERCSWEVDMYVMKEYGVEGSWSKLLTIKFPGVSWITVCGFRNNGEAIISLNLDDEDDEFEYDLIETKWLNPRTNETRGN